MTDQPGGFTLDDSELYIPLFSRVCTFCKHFLMPGKPGERHCQAFTDIPMPIWLGENNHTLPYPGDNGIQFENVEVKP